jgi:hypothetical protein
MMPQNQVHRGYKDAQLKHTTKTQHGDKSQAQRIYRASHVLLELRRQRLAVIPNSTLTEEAKPVGYTR